MNNSQGEGEAEQAVGGAETVDAARIQEAGAHGHAGVSRQGGATR